MNRETSSKIEARHLKSNAYHYVRQSTLRQVFVAFGWTRV